MILPVIHIEQNYKISYQILAINIIVIIRQTQENMHNTVIHPDDKENYKLPKQLLSSSIPTKIQKFGKSIRARALPLHDTTIPLKQTTKHANQSLIRRQSMMVTNQKPFIDDIGPMSISFISSFEDKKSENDQLSTSRLFRKYVRFSEGQEIYRSRSSRRNSILKNNSSDKLSCTSFNSHIGSICGGLTAKASVKDKGVSCQNSKYQATLKKLKQQNKKFFDDMFPPGGASLFYNKSQAEKHKDIRWLRINQVFAGQKMVLYQKQDRNTIKIGNFWSLDYMATAFNALGTSQRCLERIFEDQAYSKYGIYYLRINHGGIWKYIIVDDYIPVKKVGRSYTPIFMIAKPTKSQYYQIWPFILQKAFAKLYSTYECLMNDSLQNCIYELIGVVPETIELESNDQIEKSAYYKIKNYMMNPDNILVASCPKSREYCQNGHSKYPLKQHPKQKVNYFLDQQYVVLISSRSQSKNITYEQLLQAFSKFTIYVIDDSYYSVGCIIKQHKNPTSLRKFVVDGYGNATISIIQKDQKYYRNNGYKYSWMRLLLVTKDVDGYRWINGTYTNEKVANISSVLEPGQYYLIIIGQWNKKVYDVTLNYHGNVETQFIRVPLGDYPDILEETCRDISQRFGQFKQLNKNICSYQHVDLKNGLIIQNLNNEINRDVYYHRKYRFEFRNFKSVGNIHLNAEDEIEGFIEPNNNITLALMLLQGINKKQISSFDF